MAKTTTSTLLLSASLLTVLMTTANAQEEPDYYDVQNSPELRDQVYEYGSYMDYDDEEYRGAILDKSTADDKDYFRFDGIIVSGNTLNSNVYAPPNYSSRIKGGFITALSGITINDSSFVENHIISSGYNEAVYDGILNAGRDAGSYNDPGVITVTGGRFSHNTVTVQNQIKGAGGHVFGLVTSARNGNSASFTGTTFDGNQMNTTGRVQGGVLHVFNEPGNFFDAELTANNVIFVDNEAVAFGVARGAAVENYNATFNARDTLFQNNSVTTTGSVADGGVDGVGYDSFGGALYTDREAINHLTDVTFIGNSATNGFGGAVTIAEQATVNFTTTVNIIYSGNFATDVSGAKEDSRGGFLYMVSSTEVGDTAPRATTANFTVETGATLTIGDATTASGYDSIASDSMAIINKDGAGRLTVNGSMEYYQGNLYVNAGQMDVLNQLGATNVTVKSGATLVLLSGAYTGNGNVVLEVNSALNFILEDWFTENYDSPFYLLAGSVSINGISDINDVVTVKNNDGTNYSGDWVVGLDAGGISFTLIPEPSTYAFGAAGLLGVLTLIRRRRK